MENPVCPYCEKLSELVESKVIYPRSVKNYGSFYLCRPCWAYVGCHDNTTTPLGRLANADLRAAKMAAHSSMDKIWRSGFMRRNQTYAWLAKTLRIHPNACHIGMFDVKTCLRVIQESNDYLASKHPPEYKMLADFNSLHNDPELRKRHGKAAWRDLTIFFFLGKGASRKAAKRLATIVMQWEDTPNNQENEHGS